jgi:hypothetical protein
MKYADTFMFKLLVLVATTVALMLVQHTMLAHLAGSNTVAKIFAAGPHVDGGALVLALAFIAVRLTTFLLLPGVVVGRLGWLCVEHLAPRRRRSPAPAVGEPT